jgi:hypothetical protein
MITSMLQHDPDLFIDLRDFMPVVVSSADKRDIWIHSSVSMADLSRDAGERLLALVNFIRTSQKASNPRRYIGCTQAVAEQIAYLAYWKDYPLEFRIERLPGSIVIRARFPGQHELDCILAVFADRREPHAGVQKWFECFCRLVQDHARVWQIHLIVDKLAYRKLEEPRFFQPEILVEVVDQE